MKISYEQRRGLIFTVRVLVRASRETVLPASSNGSEPGLVEELDQLRSAVVFVPDAAEVECQLVFAAITTQSLAPSFQEVDCLAVVVRGLEFGVDESSLDRDGVVGARFAHCVNELPPDAVGVACLLAGFRRARLKLALYWPRVGAAPALVEGPLPPSGRCPRTRRRAERDLGAPPCGQSQ
jgi:hypothetical protein